MSTGIRFAPIGIDPAIRSDRLTKQPTALGWPCPSERNWSDFSQIWDQDLVKYQDTDSIVAIKASMEYESLSKEMQAVVAQESLYSYIVNPHTDGRALSRSSVPGNGTGQPRCIRPRNSTRHFP